MIKNNNEQYFSKFPFVEYLSDKEKKIFRDNTVRGSYHKGDNLHGVNQDCTGVIYVISGCLRVYMLSEEGKDITLYRLFPGDICMLSASCVIKSITFDVFVDAEEDSEVCTIRANAFKEVAEQNLYLENFALKVAVERFSEVMWTMQQILFMSFDKRLAVFINDEINKTGVDTLNLTHEQIAKYVGSAREVVSRMLKYFASEGMIEMSRGGITVIDKKKLMKLTR